MNSLLGTEDSKVVFPVPDRLIARYDQKHCIGTKEVPDLEMKTYIR